MCVSRVRVRVWLCCACRFSYFVKILCQLLFYKKNVYICIVNQLNFCFMSKKIDRVFYALFDCSLGDSLRALVTVSGDPQFLIGASEFMHRSHPAHHDFVVVRSTTAGYFGSKAVPVAFNGQLVKK